MPLAERRGDRIAVPDARWSETEIVKAIPGCRWDTAAKLWTVPLSWAACLHLRAAFGDQLVADPGLAEWLWAEFRLRVEPATALRARLTRFEEAYYDPQLYDFQTSGAEFMVTSTRTQDDGAPGGSVLGDDLGLGKTAQALAALRRLEKLVGAEAVWPALVICPNSVKTGWLKQVEKWEIPVNVYVVTGGAAKRRKLLAAAREDPRALVAINLEAVRLFSRLAPYGSTRLARCRTCDRKHGEETLTASRCEVHRKELNGFGFRSVILDEAHRIKDPVSKQTRACWAVGHDPSVRQRWAMTGTAIADHVGDLWAILHFLAPHEFPSKTQYVDRYAQQAWNQHGGLDIVGVRPEHREEFFRLLDARFRRTPKALVLDQLPGVVRSVRWVEMVPKQERAYRDMEDRLMTRLSDGSLLVAPNNLVNATRLLQLSSSYCEVTREERTIPVGQRCGCAVRTDLDGDEVHARGCPYRGHRCWCHALNRDRHVEDCPSRWRTVVTPTEPSPKLDAMEEAFDELGGKPVVIAAMHRKLIELAAKRFERRGVPYGLLTGDVGEYERQRVLDRFAAGQLKVVLLTIDAGGTGVDGLQVSDTLFCLQRSWSMISNVQLDGRLPRIGSGADTVRIVEFVTENSIEAEKQFPRLAAKYERLEEINRDRGRLLAAGVAPDQLYQLDQLERQLLGDLTEEPETGDGEAFEESLREVAERYGIPGVTDEEELP